MSKEAYLAANLIEAIRHSDAQQVAASLLAGANPNHLEDAEGITPLHHAAQFGDQSVIELLLIAGADAYAITTHDFLTPIDVAAHNGFWDIAALMGHYHQYVYTVAQIAWYLS